MKVGFFITATGKYIRYAAPLVVSAKQYLKDIEPQFYVFTDSLADGDYIRVPVVAESWPFSTAKRSFYYLQNLQVCDDCDYVFAMDADALFVGEVGQEILGETVAVSHPGFYSKPNHRFTYERRPISSAYIPEGQGSRYYAGFLYGGKKNSFAKTVEGLVSISKKDFQRGIMAIWHDESYLNRYLLDNPPEKTLTPAYCYPEEECLLFEKKILALRKDHKAMR